MVATEKRLIDANALDIGRCNPDLLPFGNRPYAAGWNGVVNIIDNAPTVDAVEVIRCKDCKHWGGKYATNECSLITQLGNPDYWLKTSPDDFCSSGKRKEK